MLEIAALQPAYLGCIFYPRSPRCIDEQTQRELLEARMCFKGKLAGVFVNEEVGSVLGKVSEYGLSVVQLHGDESVKYVRALQSGLPPAVSLWKTVAVESKESFRLCLPYEGQVEAFLFDSRSSEYGGSGKKFSWSVLEEYHLETPFVLSGGIAPGDAQAVRDIASKKTSLLGVDLNSCFERIPGEKDGEKLKRFMSELRSDE